MRVLMISKALVVGAYQKKCEELARLPGMDLHVVVPPAWQEPGGRRLVVERAFTQGYELAVEPMALNGHFHLHFYPTLHSRVRALRPDIVHIDEEPYNLATLQALTLGRSVGARCLFFTWQNLYRRYPWPWRAVESHVLARADYALAARITWMYCAERVTKARRRSFPVWRGPLRLPSPGAGGPRGATSTRTRSPLAIWAGWWRRRACWCFCMPRSMEEWRLEVVGGSPLESHMVAVAHDRASGGRSSSARVSSLQVRAAEQLGLPLLPP